MAKKKTNNKMVVKPLGNDKYDVTFEGCDYHIHTERGEWYVDCFNSKIKDTDKAYVWSDSTPSLGSALALILTGEHE